MKEILKSTIFIIWGIALIYGISLSVINEFGLLKGIGFLCSFMIYLFILLYFFEDYINSKK